jgi:hypothetical protein
MYPIGCIIDPRLRNGMDGNRLTNKKITTEGSGHRLKCIRCTWRYKFTILVSKGMSLSSDSSPSLSFDARDMPPDLPSSPLSAQQQHTHEGIPPDNRVSSTTAFCGSISADSEFSIPPAAAKSYSDRYFGRVSDLMVTGRFRGNCSVQSVAYALGKGERTSRFYWKERPWSDASEIAGSLLGLRWRADLFMQMPAVSISHLIHAYTIPDKL